MYPHQQPRWRCHQRRKNILVREGAPRGISVECILSPGRRGLVAGRVGVLPLDEVRRFGLQGGGGSNSIANSPEVVSFPCCSIGAFWATISEVPVLSVVDPVCHHIEPGRC